MIEIANEGNVQEPRFESSYETSLTFGQVFLNHPMKPKQSICLYPICHANGVVGSRKWNLFRRSGCLCRQIGEASCSFRCRSVASRSHTKGNMLDGTWPVWSLRLNYFMALLRLAKGQLLGSCCRSCVLLTFLKESFTKKSCKKNTSRHFVTLKIF